MVEFHEFWVRVHQHTVADWFHRDLIRVDRLENLIF
jgi:hypothetical protein